MYIGAPLLCPLSYFLPLNPRRFCGSIFNPIDDVLEPSELGAYLLLLGRERMINPTFSPWERERIINPTFSPWGRRIKDEGRVGDIGFRI